MTFIHRYADQSTWLGLIISTAGLLLTIWTLKTARNIQARILRRVQVPALIEAIEKSLTELNQLLLAANLNSEELRRLIRRSSVTIQSAKGKVKGAEIQKALKATEKMLKKSTLSKNDGESFHTEMTAVHEELRLIKTDDDWRYLL